MHHPVDYFLQSLAADQGGRAIGVILSGTASDGVKGMKDIKEVGGITFAQDEASSIVYGMPRAAWEIGAAQRQVPLDRAASLIIQHYAAPVGSNLRLVSASP